VIAATPCVRGAPTFTPVRSVTSIYVGSAEKKVNKGRDGICNRDGGTGVLLVRAAAGEEPEPVPSPRLASEVVLDPVAKPALASPSGDGSRSG
jgi:hypothetical protein